MKYMVAFGTGDPSSLRTVEDGSTRQTIAEECRDAALSFMAGAARGWEKADLARWLTGDYARATRHRPHGERVTTLASDGDLTEQSIDDLVLHVRGQLLASLEKAALELGSLEFVEEVVARGLVQRVLDTDGREAWIPVDAARVRLRARLHSLFAADYLNTPYTYAGLFVCHRCEAVVFDEHAKRLGVCGLHRASGAVPREADAPLPGELDADVG